MNKERLLNVAKACRESPQPEKFTMTRYGHCCGTPACAIGHYAARRDLQDAFMLTQSGGFVMNDGDYYSTRDSVLSHFEITDNQENQLFESEGCGNAQTPQQAADYIEKFVATDGEYGRADWEKENGEGDDYYGEDA